MSSWLSSQCSAVRAPLTNNACGVEMMADNNQGGISNNPPRLICFEWTPGITLREWIHSQQNHLDLSAPKGSSTGNNDNGVEDRTRCHLMSSMSLACHIIKALAEIHE
eukprot:6751061-Ditylum_brightwellii.AAC.1